MQQQGLSGGPSEVLIPFSILLCGWLVEGPIGAACPAYGVLQADPSSGTSWVSSKTQECASSSSEGNARASESVGFSG